MTAGDRPRPPDPRKDYRRLPKDVRLDETIESVESASPPDPEAGRNTDQYLARVTTETRRPNARTPR